MGEVVFRHAEPVMGTVVSFDIRPQGLPAESTRTAIAAACAVLHRADDVFSLYRDDTPMALLRSGRLALEECPPEIPEVLDLCEQARERSGGWFDPWALPGGLDPTGLVKGWAARQAANVLREQGVGAAMVNAAGDIVVFGLPADLSSWRIGIRSPFAPDELLCVVESRSAVATSGIYERGRHIWDVHAGEPASRTVSATVCGPDLALADALATGLLAGGPAGLEPIRQTDYEALIVDRDGRQLHTDSFPFAADAPVAADDTRG